MSDERGRVRSQDIRTSLQEILRVALAQVFQPRDSRLGGMQAIGQLLLGEPAELPPCPDEMRAAPFGISDTRHAARLLLTKLRVVAVKRNFCLTACKPEWWDPGEDRADTYERLAAQILDAVITLAEMGRGA
jgi:hypothetical protein